MSESLIIIDFGSQYTRLIARRVREANVFCEIHPYSSEWSDVAGLNTHGVILSGGPNSVYDDAAPLAPTWVYDKGIPVLGICYGLQVLAYQMGGKVIPSNKKEYGDAVIESYNEHHSLMQGLEFPMHVWMSHGDQVSDVPPGFEPLAYTENSPVAVMGNTNGIFGLQFHPEVVHTRQGSKIITNFLREICGFVGDWTPNNFVEESVQRIKEQVGSARVICALS